MPGVFVRAGIWFVVDGTVQMMMMMVVVIVTSFTTITVTCIVFSTTVQCRTE